MASFWFLTYYSAESDDFGIFFELFQTSEAYITLAFAMSSYVLVDVGMRYASLEIKSLMEQRKERAEYENWVKNMRKKNSTVI